jgi:regulatory protein
VVEWSASLDAFPEEASDSGPSSADIRRAAMNLLARREHGRTELVQKLMKRFDSVQDLIEEEVDKLQKDGLQSDSRLAEAFIRARFNRGQGPVKIKAELRGKGVDESIVSAAFASDETDWFQLVSDVAERRFGDTPPFDAKERAKRGRFLLQRGFSTDHIRSLDQSSR